MKILITGGTGLIGQQLTGHLINGGHQVAWLSRSESKDHETYMWDINDQYLEEGTFAGVDVLVHLVGAGIADGRWTDQRKKIILDSRVESTKLLLEKLEDGNHQIRKVIAASAVGYYGMETGDELLSESSPPGNDFLADVVVKWEEVTSKFRDLSIKTTQLRTGIVLDKHGGALGKMSTPVKFGVGAPLGTGDQWMSWIHIDDLCRMILHAIDHDLDDVYNATAPHPVSNAELTRTIAQVLRKPLFMPNIPAFALRIMLGEMASMVLGGNKVSPKKIEDTGFKFKYPKLEGALKEIMD